MRYHIHSHRNALTILKHEEEFKTSWGEIQYILDNLTDERIIECFNTHFTSSNKSLSKAINKLLKEDFSNLGWSTESPIFQEAKYKNKRNKTWRLDMAKDNISVEVAFNHGGTTAWNLLKPVLASELNHVQKAVQTKMGIIICATQELKKTGNFDNAIGTYEKYLLHLKPMMNQLSVPMLLIGLKAPETFIVSERKVGNRKLGEIMMIQDVDLLSSSKKEGTEYLD